MACLNPPVLAAEPVAAAALSAPVATTERTACKGNLPREAAATSAAVAADAAVLGCRCWPQAWCSWRTRAKAAPWAVQVLQPKVARRHELKGSQPLQSMDMQAGN